MIKHNNSWIVSNGIFRVVISYALNDADAITKAKQELIKMFPIERNNHEDYKAERTLLLTDN